MNLFQDRETGEILYGRNLSECDRVNWKHPVGRLNRLEKECGADAEIIGKLEYFNPAGSVKDRVAAQMIEDAEAAGKLKKKGPSSLSPHPEIQESENI